MRNRLCAAHACEGSNARRYRGPKIPELENSDALAVSSIEEALRTDEAAVDPDADSSLIAGAMLRTVLRD